MHLSTRRCSGVDGATIARTGICRQRPPGTRVSAINMHFARLRRGAGTTTPRAFFRPFFLLDRVSHGADMIMASIRALVSPGAVPKSNPHRYARSAHYLSFPSTICAALRLHAVKERCEAPVHSNGFLGPPCFTFPSESSGFNDRLRTRSSRR